MIDWVPILVPVLNQESSNLLPVVSVGVGFLTGLFTGIAGLLAAYVSQRWMFKTKKMELDRLAYEERRKRNLEGLEELHERILAFPFRAGDVAGGLAHLKKIGSDNIKGYIEVQQIGRSMLSGISALQRGYAPELAADWRRVSNTFDGVMNELLAYHHSEAPANPGYSPPSKDEFFTECELFADKVLAKMREYIK